MMDLETLKRSVRGTVTAAGEEGFAESRAALLWNARRPARRPGVIVEAVGVEDVRAAVRFAAANGLGVSPRGSGHQFSGIAMQEGVVIDLSGMNRVVVDPAARIAEAEPGVTNAVLAQTLGGYGLAFPVGHCGSVAISGYLLGGGFGWNAGSWGVACHNVESVDVVLADGSLRRASATENPEIFWAVQGGGPAFFGVVVRYRLRLQALPRVMKASLRTYPLDRVGEVEAWLAASATAGPSNVERTIMMTAAPEPIAAQVAQVATGIATVFADDEAEADRLLADVGATAPLGALDVHEGIPVSFDMLYAISDSSHPAGARWAVDSFWGARPGDGLVAALAERMAMAPTPQSFALAAVEAPLPGPLPDAAFSMVGAVFGAAHAIWHDAADDADCVGWLRQTADAASAHAIGHYVGEADLDRPGRLAACYSTEAWEKLAALRLRYDPAGVFDRTGTGAAALRRAG